MNSLQQPGFCATGHELSTEVKRHDRLVEAVQRQMQAIHQAEDSSDRRVPRILHDTLRSHMEPRTLALFYWEKHRAQCGRCEDASLAMRSTGTRLAA
jgi:hypothetical protein